MISCRISKLYFAHDGGLPVLENVFLHLAPGWYGLVGENGSGKTTLLRLLAGELQPDAGSVCWQPAGARIVMCRQDIDVPPDGAEMLAEEVSGKSSRLRGLFELHEDDLQRWSTLSPGERKRWQVAAALVRAPDVLLLDEPSNHLDVRARELLSVALREFSGVGVLVSHQRELLEQLTRATLQVRRGSVRPYAGAYEEARRQWEAEERERRGQRERLQGQLRKTERKLQKARQRQEAAEGQMSARKRMKNRHDKDGRSILAKNRVAFAEARHGKTVGVQRREMARAKEAVANVLASAQPSPGQARKLALALGLGRQVWLLVLDEPTNHLDLPSIERIERALEDYPGALILVTHDATLAAHCTTLCWDFQERQVCVLHVQ